MKVRLPLFLAVSICFVCACHPIARDRMLEKRLSELLTEQQGNAPYLELIPILGNNWEKVCLQGPYQSEERFEKQIGRKVSGFQEIWDNLYVFWVFHKDG